MRVEIAKALIDADPSIEGYHQTHIDIMGPRVDAVMKVIGPKIALLRAALIEITEAETPHANATVRRMADIARKALQQ